MNEKKLGVPEKYPEYPIINYGYLRVQIIGMFHAGLQLSYDALRTKKMCFPLWFWYIVHFGYCFSP